MKTKFLLFSLLIGALLLNACKNNSSSSSIALKTTADSVYYYLGYMQASSMSKQLHLNDATQDAYIAGIKDGIQNLDLKKNPMEIQMFMNKYFMEQMQREAEENKAKGEKFLKENAQKSGIDTLANGIQYKVVKEGKGPKPAATDKVKVHYKGTFIDGKEFDSSYKREEPAEFYLNQVIPGWTEALQAMPQGSKWIIYLPSDMAYGPRGNGNGIGPNEALIFEVELLEINPQPSAKESAK